MITSEHRKALKELAQQVGFKIVTSGYYLQLGNKCTTSRFTNDEAGYEAAKAKLEQIASHTKQETQP